MLKPKKENLIQARIECGLSQHQLSKNAGLSGCAVQRLESGKTKLTHPLRAKEIAKALDCDVSEIFEKAPKRGV